MARNGFARIETTNAAAARVRRALRKADGHQQRAAELLNVSRSTMQRWLTALELVGFAARLRQDAGVSGPRVFGCP